MEWQFRTKSSSLINKGGLQIKGCKTEVTSVTLVMADSVL